MRRKHLIYGILIVVAFLICSFIGILIFKNNRSNVIEYTITQIDGESIDSLSDNCFDIDELTTMIVKLGGQYEISTISLEKKGVPEEYSVWSCDQYGNKKMQYKEGEPLIAAYLFFEFIKPINVDKFSLEVKGIAQYEKVLDEPNDEILLEAMSKDNPLHVYRKPIPKVIQMLANNILDEYGKNLSDHEKICAFMDYIQKYQIGNFVENSDEYLVRLAKERIGACGDYSNMVAALAATQGLQTKLITLGNYPENDGHAVINVLIDGEWCLYDPTFDTYWVDDTGDILGFDELSNMNDVELDKIQRITRDESHFTSELSYKFVDCNIYRDANPKGELGLQNKLYYPNTICLYDNLNSNDLWSAHYQGAGYLGIANTSKAHIWNCTGLVEGQKYVLEIKATGIGGEIFDPFISFAKSEDCDIELDSANHTFSDDVESLTWSIEFKAKSTDASIVLDFDEESDLIHYVNFESVYLFPYDISEPYDVSLQIKPN